MTDTDLCGLTVTDLATLIRERQVSPVEIAQACLRRIEDLNPRLNTFITVAADRALDQARQAERAVGAGAWMGPLHGIPVAIKDNCATEGILTTAGSRLLADAVPGFDATVVARLRAAGAVILGKTNMHEFAYGGTNAVSHVGPARNPWNPGHIAGGSSGGSGAAVASGMAPVALGSDTGGSIRIPAAACGVAGIKPTFGRVSRHGVIPLSWSLDHVGPLARSVEDLATALSALAGHDPLDDTTVSGRTPVEPARWSAILDGMRIGIDRCPGFSVDTQVAERFSGAVEVLEDLGAEVEEVALPQGDDAFIAWKTIMTVEASRYHEPWLATDRRGLYDFDVLIQLEAGRHVTAQQYLKAVQYRIDYGRRIAYLAKRFDAVVMPTLPVAAPPLGQEKIDIAGREITVQDAMTFTNCLANMTGRPAVTVPCGFSDEWLPIGMTIMGAPMEEATILRIAAAYEHATGWHNSRPPV